VKITICLRKLNSMVESWHLPSQKKIIACFISKHRSKFVSMLLSHRLLYHYVRVRHKFKEFSISVLLKYSGLSKTTIRNPRTHENISRSLKTHIFDLCIRDGSRLAPQNAPASDQKSLEMVVVEPPNTTLILVPWFL
jgi:hypothetical protein